MEAKQRILAATEIIKARMFNKKIPVVVRWQLTNRCMSRCRYCNRWKNESEELTTDQIISLLDEVGRIPVRVISFSGGEPLLREDIGIILDYCRKKGISAEMNSNGRLVPVKIRELKEIDLLKLSLDGPEEIHDFLRYKGSYEEVIKAAEAASNNGIKFTFAMTMTEQNIEHTDFFLEMAKKFDTMIAFQPLEALYRGITREEMELITPSPVKFKQTVEKLISEKKKGNKHIRNSLIGLKHIYNWPVYSKLKCRAGQIFCVIQADGTLCPCDRISYNVNLPNCMDIGFREALEKLPEVVCSGCGACGALELNYLFYFRWSVVPVVERLKK